MDKIALGRVSRKIVFSYFAEGSREEASVHGVDYGVDFLFV